MFIVLEGLDGAGTTTQLEPLANWLEGLGRTVVRTHEPTDGPVGRLIRQSLRAEPEAPAPQTLPWMFAADRADHLARTVEPALRRGEVVLSDRYLHSSLAYQSETLGLDYVHTLNERFRVPDLTVFLEVPVHVSLSRIDARGGERELFDTQERLTAIAARYAAVLEHLVGLGQDIVRLDGTATQAEVTAGVRAAVQRLNP